MKKLLLALTFAAVTTSAFAAGKQSVLPFVQDDYDKAVAEARAKNVPLFVEVWAPW